MIKELVSHYCNGNKAQFANMLGVKPQTINSWITRETFDAELIYANCAGISAAWLISGEGEMLKPSNSPTTTNERRAEKSHQHQHTELEIETRPRIPMEAAAGSLSVLTQSVDQSQCDQVPVIASIPDYDFTIMVKGDSMVPEFKSGDEIACRLIRESAFIQWGQPYVVDSYNGIVLKRIHDNGDSIKCTSDNPQYGAFYIPKSEIYRLALVVGLVRLY